MKVRCYREAITNAVSHACQVVENIPQRPELACALLKAESNKVRISATDLEISLAAQVTEVEVHEPGAAVVPAGRLLDVLRHCDGRDVELVGDGASLRVTSPNSKYLIYGFESDRLPEFNPANEKPNFGLSAAAFKQMLERTSFAASTASSGYGPNLNCLLLLAEGGNLEAVASDGKRIAQASSKLLWPLQQPVSLLCSLRGISLLTKMIPPDGEVLVRSSGPDAQFFSGNLSASLRTVHGDFIKYRDAFNMMLPEHGFAAPAASVADLFEKALVNAHNESRRVRLDLENGTARTSASSAEGGEAEASMPIAEQIGGGSMLLNGQMLVEAARRFGDDRVRVNFSTKHIGIQSEQVSISCNYVQMAQTQTGVGSA